MNDSRNIERIRIYCSKIIRYMNGILSFDMFLANEEKVDAIILNLEQIGETAKKLTSEARQYYTNINWKKIIGLRNMIAHEYEGILLQIIYEIVCNEIPKLLLSITNN